MSSPRTSTNSEPSNETPPSKFSFKSELPQPCSKSVDEKRLSTNETLISSSSSVGGRPNSRDNGFSPSADAGNLPLTDVPFTNSGGDPLEKMARLTQETLPFEPPLVISQVFSRFFYLPQVQFYVSETTETRQSPRKTENTRRSVDAGRQTTSTRSFAKN